MKAATFEQQNDVLGAGDNVNTNDLPICRTHQNLQRGVETVELPVILSKWELSEEEIEYIKEHKCIWLMVRGQTHPPLLPMAENPFYSPGDYVTVVGADNASGFKKEVKISELESFAYEQYAWAVKEYGEENSYNKWTKFLWVKYANGTEKRLDSVVPYK